MLPRLSGPALLLLLPLLPSLLAGGGSHGALAEVLFRCPPCTPGSKNSAVPALRWTLLSLFPGLGAAGACFRIPSLKEGGRIGQNGTAWSPAPAISFLLPILGFQTGHPELFLRLSPTHQCRLEERAERKAAAHWRDLEFLGWKDSQGVALVLSRGPRYLVFRSRASSFLIGRVGRLGVVAGEPTGFGVPFTQHIGLLLRRSKRLCFWVEPSPGDTIDDSDGGLAENHVDGTVSVLGGGVRKPHKSGMKELAVIREKVIGQHRQLGKVNMHHHIHEDTKKLRPPPTRTPCQQELDQVLERISTMRLPDERGPLEHLYSLHIPNCDKQGLYNLKQCKMSLNGQRGECWCVNPHTGKLIQGAPTIRGDPECHLFYTEQEARGAHAQRMQ
ncbi:insulin-like growth factor-binding protein 2 [Gracilinanus agilis]|uniref:insulin-like growth factor-binding protein 2 n=1 Tax=Gracilinanus agilis TaxID=191870 RepID=UPI001CFD52C2|nr:insulin-like growth factor-binding protein 2 [Gracilinanus agilis]